MGSALIGVLALALACAGCATQPEFDAIVSGGTVIDGTGGEPRRADIGIKGDRITAVGNLGERVSSTIIDVTGKTVAPGLINVLGRSGVTLLASGAADNAIRQGITTEILGANSPAFWTRTTADEQALRTHGLTLDWSGLGGYFDKLDARGTAVNVGTFVPLSVTGPTDEAAINRGMSDGAFGAIDDTPAGATDLTITAGVVGRNGGVLVLPARSPLAGSDDALFAIGTQARQLLIGDLAHPATSVGDVVGRMVRGVQRGIAMNGAVMLSARPEDQAPLRDALRYGSVMTAADEDETRGAFPRLLGQMARDERVIELREAIRRNTSMAAAMLQLPTRGIIRENWFADLVVFDEKAIADRATADKPNQAPTGIDYVIVNGVAVVTPKGVTGARPGYRLLHRSTP